MFIVFSVLLGLFVLFADTAHCQDSYPLYKVPEGHRLTTAGRKVIQGYTLEEHKQLLLVDSELRACDLRVENFLSSNIQLHLALYNLQEVVKEQIKEKDLLLTSLDEASSKNKSLKERLDEKLSKEHRIARIGVGLAVLVVGGVSAGLFTSYLR
jgi:hypothetical protein